MPNFVENIPCRDIGLLLSFVWFYDEPNRPPTLCTKFEVDTFSHCINIKGNPQIFGELPLANPSCIPNLKSLALAVAEILKGNTKILGSSPSPWPRQLFRLGGILWWALANPTSLPILKSLPSVVAEILKGNPQFRGAPLDQGYAHFSLSVIFYDGHRHTEAVYQIWSC